MYQVHYVLRFGTEIPGYARRHSSYWLKLLNTQLPFRMYCRRPTEPTQVKSELTFAVFEYPYDDPVPLIHACERIQAIHGFLAVLIVSTEDDN